VSDLRRYARQMRLAEVGDAGQRRLGDARAAVAGEGLKHEVATAYASRAGIGGIVAGEVDESSLAPSFIEHAAPRAVVAGSRAALAALRAALFASTGSPRSLP
jgi:sulfur-carrier protein adenylyltransferase/sulfurtransferase